MKDKWDDSLSFDGPLEECVYGSRLIGQDADLVLHGGGNTSVKAGWVDVTGETIDALYVKGSGWDLADIEEPGFTPLPLGRMRELLAVDRLSDSDMMAALAAARLDPSAPMPSVETLLHALLPFPAVEHSHADVIVALTNLADGEERARRVFGNRAVVVPYVMPGFELAKAVAEIWPKQSGADTAGMVLLNHGLFTFAQTTREAYRHHVDLITLAERYLDEEAPSAEMNGPPLPDIDLTDLARLRRRLSDAAAAPMIMSRHTDRTVRWFVNRPDLADLAQRGPLTPDHVIRTKRLPLVGRDIDGYTAAYQDYFERNRHRGRSALTMLDPAPRVILDSELGMLTAGRTARDAGIAADIYHHTMGVLDRSERLGGYVALPEGDLFEVEYWELEQAKLHRGGSPPELTGKIALVTGAASGIGRACASELLTRGAAVVGLDVATSVTDGFPDSSFVGLVCDVTNAAAVDDALRVAVERFGGIDLLVAAAGVFGESRPIADSDAAEWRRVFDVNVDSVTGLLSRLHPLLALAPGGARVVLIGSKNVAAPGRGAAAYSASKAALTQLARVAALEWATDGIRVNTVHPDAVFDTGLWTDSLLAERAARYGLSTDEYKRRCLLGVEVTSAAVARLVAEMCGETFAATTGAQVPIDGGNERVI